MSGENSAESEPACPSDLDDDSEMAFVDVVFDGRGDEGAKSEAFTFADALISVNVLSEAFLEDVVKSYQLFRRLVAVHHSP